MRSAASEDGGGVLPGNPGVDGVPLSIGLASFVELLENEDQSLVLLERQRGSTLLESNDGLVSRVSAES